MRQRQVIRRYFCTIARIAALPAFVLGCATSVPVDDATTDEGITTDSPAPSALRIYVSPAGDDAQSGRTPNAPVATLDRVHQVLQQEKPRTAVEILFAEGTYLDQSVRWTFFVEHETITFRPARRGDAVVFDGCSDAASCPERTWFSLAADGGQETRLRFHDLTVRHYSTAISLAGNRNDATKFNGGNEIVGCRFADIGNAYRPSLKPSTAAVRLVNSRKNAIRDNVFERVVNVAKPSLIHAIYVAHGSSGNTVSGNVFSQISGDPVRLRDGSDDNTISGNRFEGAGRYGFRSGIAKNTRAPTAPSRRPNAPPREMHFSTTFSAPHTGAGEWRSRGSISPTPPRAARRGRSHG